MSQEKVNKYKEEKKNRKEVVKKEKRNALLVKVCVGVLVLALLGWIGYSVVDSAQDKKEESNVVMLDPSALVVEQ